MSSTKTFASNTVKLENDTCIRGIKGRYGFFFLRISNKQYDLNGDQSCESVSSNSTAENDISNEATRVSGNQEENLSILHFLAHLSSMQG